MEAGGAYSREYLCIGVANRSSNPRFETKKVEDGYTELSPEDSLLDILIQWGRKKACVLMCFTSRTLNL